MPDPQPDSTRPSPSEGVCPTCDSLDPARCRCAKRGGLDHPWLWTDDEHCCPDDFHVCPHCRSGNPRDWNCSHPFHSLEITCRLCGIGFSPDRMSGPCTESTTNRHEFFPTIEGEREVGELTKRIREQQADDSDGPVTVAAHFEGEPTPEQIEAAQRIGEAAERRLRDFKASGGAINNPPTVLTRAEATHRVRSIARRCGYAVGEHGTRGQDLDLMLAPWTDLAGIPELVIDDIAAAIPGKLYGPERKPHGRLAWSLHPDAHATADLWNLDLSVLPPAPPDTTPSEERCETCGRTADESPVVRDANGWHMCMDTFHEPKPPSEEPVQEGTVHNATIYGPEDLDPLIEAIEAAGYEFGSATSFKNDDEILSALDTANARASQYEQDRKETVELWNRANEDCLKANIRAEAAESQASKLREERDGWMEWARRENREWSEKVGELEARSHRYEEALREIAAFARSQLPEPYRSMLLNQLDLVGMFAQPPNQRGEAE